MNKKYGLALEGGGARGAYEAGAIKLLTERGYKFSCVCGTSIGAINAAMVAQGDSEKLIDIWHDISYSQVFDVDEKKITSAMNKEINPSIIKYVSSFLVNTVKEKGIDTAKMREIIENQIDEKKLRKSKINFGLVTICITDKKPKEMFLEDIPEGKLHDFVLASGRLPVFKQELLDDKYYMDGGVYNNCPINMLDKKEIKDIIVIKLGSVLPTKDEKKLLKRKDLNITVIEPNFALPNILAFDNEVSNYLINLGYFDALKKIDGLFGEKYYLKQFDEDKCFQSILSIDQKSINDIYSILKLKDVANSKKVFLEIVFPMILKKIGKDNLGNYKEAMMYILEYLATLGKVDKFKVYSMEEFFKLTKDSIKNINKNAKMPNVDKVIIRIVNSMKI